MVAASRGVRVKELVKRPPITIPATASLLEAADTLTRHNVGALVVVDQSEKPVAVLSERDIVRAISQRMPLSTPVEAFMSTWLVTIDANETVEKAAELMWINNIRHLVVTEGGKAIGVISIRDLINPKVLSSFCK
ncbi:CBS domain-containing protein [Pyrobaculum sp.]|uniref:CBS domain-containing protein n=1 Tax=Pyrobaculum sp. TaxID=2004705 RepID=UPI003165B460